MALMTSSIFCTEPHKIQNAGKVDICCFDKTGTLTETSPTVKGVGNIYSDQETMIKLKEVSKINRATLNVLAGCHSLSSIDDNLVGDPLEKQIFEGLDFTL